MIEHIHQTSDDTHDVLIIGAGPIGLACAIEGQRRGMRQVVLEKGCVVNSIYNYPTQMTFHSTAPLLELADVPFISNGDKPTRAEALAYYRRVAEYFGLPIRLYEEVLDIDGEDGDFTVITSKGRYHTRKVIAATGAYERPRLLGVAGEDLPKVTHYYREAHAYAGQRLMIIGSGNSAVDAGLECFRSGAKVTMVVRGADFHEGVKYWLRPDIENRIRSGEMDAYFSSTVARIADDHVVLSTADRGDVTVPNDFVLAMTGYEPDLAFLRHAGIDIGDDQYHTPSHNEQTYETNRAGIYVAGVVVGGMCTNRWFIENSRAHATAIFDDIQH